MPDQASNPLFQMIPFVLVFLIFYFLVIKPEKTKQNERKKKLAELKKNDQVVTAAGIHGIIVNVKETTVIVRVDDNVRLEIDKEAIVTVKEVAS
ncbi:MAG: preprotein translocase subunit YajC [Candidatus Omnitrophica bacterium]|nr:preprotein translocase subunit YajC [Candidatus Omnitrophota bacterium]